MIMVMTLLVLLLAATAVLWLQPPARPRPVRARRNRGPEELRAAYRDEQPTARRW